MTQAFNYFSINNIFWIHFRSHLFSFGFKGLPKDVHFTIAYNNNSPDVNIHITKNVGFQIDKPIIRIAVVDKKILNEFSHLFYTKIFRVVTRPIDIKRFMSKYPKLKFISLTGLEQSEHYESLKEVLINSLKDISKTTNNKSRLKIYGNIEKYFKQIAKSPKVRMCIKQNMVNIPKQYSQKFDGGILILGKRLLSTIRINNNWFEVNKNVDLKDILLALTDERAVEYLMRYTRMAIEFLQNTDSCSDFNKISRPVRFTNITK